MIPLCPGQNAILGTSCCVLSVAVDAVFIIEFLHLLVLSSSSFLVSLLLYNVLFELDVSIQCLSFPFMQSEHTMV